MVRPATRARRREKSPASLADELFLLMEGAQVSTVLGVRIPARNVTRAADALIDSHLQRARRAQAEKAN